MLTKTRLHKKCRLQGIGPTGDAPKGEKSNGSKLLKLR